MTLNKFTNLEVLNSKSNPSPLTTKLNEMVDAINGTDSQRAKAMSGDMVFKCTPATVDGVEADQDRGAGVAQVETLTPVIINTALVTAGNAKLTISETGNDDIEITFALAQGDEQAGIVTKAKTALDIASVTDLYTVGGTSSTITLTKDTIEANDTGFKLKIEPVTCGDELGAVVSVNTTSGVAPYTRSVVVNLEDSEGNVHDWFNGDITVSVSESTAGDGEIETADLTPAMVSGTVTIPITFSGAWTNGEKQVETISATKGTGTSQVETITCTAGESTGAGNITMTVTASGMSNSPKAVTVAVAENDGVNDVGLALRTALAADSDVSSFFTVSGADASAILTAITPSANDATLEMGFVDTDTTGVTFGASTDTTAGVSPSAGDITITVTSAGMDNSPKDVVVAIGETDYTASQVGELVRTALDADEDVSAFFTVGGTGADISLTALVESANDATLEIAFTDTDTTGVTFGSSTDTTAGVAKDTNTLTVAQQTILGYTVAQKTSVETTATD